MLTFYELFQPEDFLLETTPVKAVRIPHHNPVEGIFHCGRQKKATFLRENAGEANRASILAVLE